MKVCKNCGIRNPDGASFCAVCGAPLKKGGGHGWRIALAALLAVLVLGGGAAAGWWFFLREDFTAFYQPISEADVRFENGALIVDSQLLVTAREGVSRRAVEKLAAGQGGQVVGYLSVSNDYQIAFPAGKTADELAAIAEQWSSDGRIEAAGLHYASRISPESYDYTTDPWMVTNGSEKDPWQFDGHAGDWDELRPGGRNWWAEALWLPSVWELDFPFKPVKVGVIDCGFDTTQRDLEGRLKKVYQNPEEITLSHGTHVAGIIAANNNTIGICGVAQNAELYAFAFSQGQTELAKYDGMCLLSPMEYKYAISTLLNDGVRVISVSLGDHDMIVSAQFDADAGKDADTSYALFALRQFQDAMGRFLEKCLKRYDFFIVKSAGNEEGEQFAENAHPDADCPYSYKEVHADGITPGTVDLRYDILAGIENEAVRSHILVVGAVERMPRPTNIRSESQTGAIWGERAYFSNGEPEIYAPGVRILSLSAGQDTELMDGTSMATPMVAGVAALVWGVDPALSAAQVRQILLDSRGASAFYPQMVNALAAVTQAMGSLKDTPAQTPAATAGTCLVTGYAYDKDYGTNTSVGTGNPGQASDVLRGARFVLYGTGENAAIITPETAADGSFTELLAPGTYILSARAEGYTPADMTVTVQADGTNYFPIPLSHPATSVTFRREYTEKETDGHTGYFEYGVLTGLDSAGNTVWTAQTKLCGREPYDVVFPVGQAGGLYYYVEDGEAVALEVGYGDERWRSGRIGDVSDALVAEDGNIYLCCIFEGPAFVGLSGAEGMALGRIDDFDPDYNDFDAVDYENGYVKVHPYNLVGQQVLFYVNISDFSWYRAGAPAGGDFWTETPAPQPSPDIPLPGSRPEEQAYQAFLQSGGYYWEVTCLDQPQYALYDREQDGVQELIIRGELLSGGYSVEMFYSYTYADGQVVYQGRQELMPMGCDAAMVGQMRFTPFELVYNYAFTQAELHQIAKSLGAPDGVEITDYAVSGPPSYWEGTGSWTVDIELWGSGGGYASTGLVLGTNTPVHIWVPWNYG